MSCYYTSENPPTYDFLKEIFRLCFSVKEPAEPELKAPKTPCYNVTDKLFSNVKIQGTDAAYPKRFSDAYVGYDIRNDNAVPLSWFWSNSVEDIVKNHYGEQKSVNNLILCVEQFFKDENNIQQLWKVKNSKTEAEIQAILSHHLFSKLVPSGTYIMDADRMPVGFKKCPACNADLVLGNTSIGNYMIWYGHPDILVDRATVKVKIEEEESEDETEEYEWPEPVIKKLKKNDDGRPQIQLGAGDHTSGITNRFSTCTEFKKDNGFEAEKDLKQTFAQTITNAFYQTKENPEMEDIFVPSFLISDVKLQIVMYNCKRDRLYISEDMFLFEALSKNGLNVGTVIAVWLALNFENFKQDITEEEVYETIGHGKSAFQAHLSDEILLIYKQQLQRPLPQKKKHANPKSSTTLGRRVVRSKKWIETYNRLDNLASKYFSESYDQ